MNNSKFLPILAASVAAGSTIRNAAKSAGCSESNAYAISRTPEFQAQVAAIRTEAIAGAVGRITSAAAQAVDTLQALLAETYEPTVRLNAAKAILTHLGPISEHGELRQRVDSLEARAHLKVVR